jgi:ankyrin repeat protein
MALTQKTIVGNVASMLKPDERFGGGYILRKLLGQGGMGQVWLADETFTQNDKEQFLRQVCIKIVPPEVQHTEAEMQRVKDVFQQTHILHHTNICPVYGLKFDGQHGFYLVMKYIQGKTLNKIRLNLLKHNGKITIEDAVRILFPIANALDYAHQSRVIHRDIKPDNILIDRSGMPFIIDFGLSAQIHTSLTSVSRIVTSKSGTLIYKSPEQWQGELQDAKTDQYSFGVLAYEFLSGRVPFIADTVDLLGYQVLNIPVPKIVELSDEVNEIFAKVLAKERKERYNNCVEFIRELRASSKDTTKPPHKINYKNNVDETNEESNEESKRNIPIEENKINPSNNPTSITNPTPEALFDAVQKGDLQKVKELINAGIDVNTKNDLGDAPLRVAQKNNVNIGILTYLGSQGGKINEYELVKTPPGYSDTNRRHLTYCPNKINLKNVYGCIGCLVMPIILFLLTVLFAKPTLAPTPITAVNLFAAVQNSNLQNVKELINGGIDVNTKEVDLGNTPLHHAATHNANVDILKYLLSQGAKVNAKDNAGSTPLHHAAKNNTNVDILKYLVSQGTDVNEKDKDGFTSLHFAARHNANVEIVKYLVSQRAKVNATSEGDTTPLHFAAGYNNNVEILKYLVSQGANVNAKDKYNDTPLHYAAVNNGNVEIVKYLVSQKAAINTRNNYGNTPIHFVAGYNANVEILKYLVSQGADVNEKDYNELTPLHYAAWNNTNVAILEYLISQGADINARKKDGSTPLHYAALRNAKVEILKYLVSQGADVNAKDYDGYTPLKWAMNGKQQRNINYLKSLSKL